MAIAAPRPQRTEAPTQETGTLPRLEEQERRRVSLTLPRIAPGRYLAMEDGEDILFKRKVLSDKAFNDTGHSAERLTGRDVVGIPAVHQHHKRYTHKKYNGPESGRFHALTSFGRETIRMKQWMR